LGVVAGHRSMGRVDGLAETDGDRVPSRRRSSGGGKGAGRVRRRAAGRGKLGPRSWGATGCRQQSDEQDPAVGGNHGRGSNQETSSLTGTSYQCSCNTPSRKRFTAAR